MEANTFLDGMYAYLERNSDGVMEQNELISLMKYLYDEHYDSETVE